MGPKSSKFKSLKNQLRSLEESDFDNQLASRPRSKGSSISYTISKYVLFGAFVISFLFYAGARYDYSPTIVNPIDGFVEWVDQPNEQLLDDMGTWMEEMGYSGLSREDLIDLRSEGVTATFTSRMRDLGYTDLTLDDLVRLRQNDVSATFSAMMKELGYDLTIEELIQLRQHGVTAYYTSNLHDLGYTDLTKEELIRLKNTGVSTSMAEKLVSERESQPTVEDLIRYHISNQ